MKILLIFTLCLISDGGASMEVTGYSGGGIIIRCKYDRKYEQNLKYFCKGSGPLCDNQIKTEANKKVVQTGRFSLYDNISLAAFRVWIRELTVEDSGTYQCGVDRSVLDSRTPVKVTVKEAGALSSREVTAYAGGGIIIKCRYDLKYTNNLKSFCKIGSNWCFNGIKPEPNSGWKHDGRLSVHDNSSAGFISVIIRELITKDTGTYWCAVTVSHLIKTYTEVKLNVREYQNYGKTINKTVHVGENTTFTCIYPESHRNDPKFLCKRQKTDVCVHKISVNEERIQTEQKFSLHDDRANQILSVSIKEVREQDSGEYWCGAEADWESDHGYKVYITQIKLTVPDPHPVTPSVPTTTSSPSSSSSSSSSTDLLLPTPTSPPAAFPASTLITVSVSLVGLLIGISLIIMILIKRSQKEASDPGSGSKPEVPLTVCDYEEIKDTRRLSASDTGTSPVYAKNAQLPTIPSDSSQAVYATAQLPTIPSDEGPTYASVSFRPKTSKSTDAGPKMIFMKEEEGSCDYATVRHVTS